MANKYIKFNEEEYELISRQAERLYQHVGRISPREVRRKSQDFMALKALISKLQGPNVEQTALRRQEIRVIEKLVDTAINSLSNTIIPGYETRKLGVSLQDERERYDKYIENSKTNLNHYIAIKAKLEGVL